MDGRLSVFVVPADRQLDLRAVGKRTRSRARRPSARRATSSAASARSASGALPTTVDESALEWETILVSAGRRGLQIELDPADLVRLTQPVAQIGDLGESSYVPHQKLAAITT